MGFSRVFAMPDPETFSIKPIGDFVRKYLAGSKKSVDPFARNKRWATHTNDLDPQTVADHHLNAEDFLTMLKGQGVSCDLGLFDPPYSPRQISEVYKSIGRKVTTGDTQSGKLYRLARNALDQIIEPGGIVLSFGWQSVGMGVKRGYEIIEILMVSHGGAHNDTICIAERKLPAGTAARSNPKLSTNALQAPAITSREGWLNAFVEMARPFFEREGKPLPANVRAAICPPHRSKQAAIGLCWSDQAAEDAGREIWVSAAYTDPVRVAGILVHELCHAALPAREKHGKAFGRVARALGLEGPLKATTEGEVFRTLWAGVLARLGPIPTAARFTLPVASGFRVQKTPKATNVSCPKCGFVAKVRLDQMAWGRLVCPAHGARLLRKEEPGWVERGGNR